MKKKSTIRYLTKSVFQTQKLGKILAAEILKTKPAKGALVIVLEGDLGSGKTAFLQGFANGLEIKEKVLSPTFLIFRKFKIPPKNKLEFNDFYHFDCYRIQSPKEILAIGFKDIISGKNIVAIEWAEKIKKILPKETIWLKFKFLDKTKREISAGKSEF